MKRSIWLILALALAVGPAFAQKVYIDFDKAYDATGIETFGWKETEDTSVRASNPLLHSRIVNGIEYYLALGGNREVEENPDVWVTYHASTETKVSFDTTHWGYGYPSSWAHGGYYGRYGYSSGYGGVSSTTVSTYEKGTLVVDVWDAATDQLIWRGMASNIAVTDNPAKMEKRIDKALKKMVDQWRKMKAKHAKE